MASVPTASMDPDRRSTVFLALLLLLVGVIFVYPLLARDVPTRLVLDFVVCADLVAMLFVAGHYRRLAHLATALGVADLVFNVLGFMADSRSLDLLSTVVDLAFWGLLLGTLLASVLREERVTG